ncbi:hypothetical protein [Pedobacter agri]|uniref:hypothetical protein n=1 Tax=Pedobacter agri TaxID=454586 RepID=UPI00292E7802|nr:hypothetical protein [Pedobacter agri]
MSICIEIFSRLVLMYIFLKWFLHLAKVKSLSDLNFVQFALVVALCFSLMSYDYQGPSAIKPSIFIYAIVLFSYWLIIAYLKKRMKGKETKKDDCRKYALKDNRK